MHADIAVLTEHRVWSVFGVADRGCGPAHQGSWHNSRLCSAPVGPVERPRRGKELHHILQTDRLRAAPGKSGELPLDALRVVQVVIVPLAVDLAARTSATEVAQGAKR